MRHQVSIANFTGENAIVSSILAAAHGKGENKKITSMFNVVTKEYGYTVHDHKQIPYLGTDFDEAIKVYNSIRKQDES